MLFNLIASLGLMFILKYGSILAFLRNFLTSRSELFKELFNCSLCLGFWTGFIVATITVNSSSGSDYVLLPFASAAFCNIIDMLLDKLLEK